MIDGRIKLGDVELNGLGARSGHSPSCQREAATGLRSK
jgi:hypothetical protein